MSSLISLPELTSVMTSTIQHVVNETMATAAAMGTGSDRGTGFGVTVTSPANVVPATSDEQQGIFPDKVNSDVMSLDDFHVTIFNMKKHVSSLFFNASLF